MSSESKPAKPGTQFTKIAASLVAGLVLYKLWNKVNNRDPNVRIQSLHVYPVKSLKGFEVDSWPISKYGLKYDREWMIYNIKSKRFVTQREIHKLALVKAELIRDSDIESDTIAIGIKLSAPNTDSITVSIVENENNKNLVENITLWKDKVSGIDQGDQIAQWLTNYINNGRQYRLIRIGKQTYKRETNPKYTPNHLQGQSNATYSDGYPYLIVSQASLDDLNNELIKRGLNEIPMDRFRPNIVIKTDLNEGFIEDRISRLTLIPSRINNLKIDKLKNNKLLTFYLTHPCARCQIPTINQETGIRNKNHEPTLTLRKFRSGKCLGFEQSKYEDVFFGVNAIHDQFDETSKICKGDFMLAFFK